MLENESTDSSVQNLTPTLVAKLLEGDAEAAVLLDQLYREALIRFCWGYLGRIEEAEDAVQEICYKVLIAEHIPNRFRPWLYKIARNHSLNLLRERGIRKDEKSLPHVSQIRDALTGHLTGLVKNEQQQRVAQLVKQLSDTHKEVLRLRYVEDLSRQEIAEVLDLSEPVVKSRLFEGLKKLREYSSLLES